MLDPSFDACTLCFTRLHLSPAAVSKVLDLLEAVEGLKEGIWKGDSRTLGKVEQAVGKVAERIDVYLILAVRRMVYAS